jgi:hypothetical protein
MAEEKPHRWVAVFSLAVIWMSGMRWGWWFLMIFLADLMDVRIRKPTESSSRKTSWTHLRIDIRISKITMFVKVPLTSLLGKVVESWHRDFQVPDIHNQFLGRSFGKAVCANARRADRRVVGSFSSRCMTVPEAIP